MKQLRILLKLFLKLDYRDRDSKTIKKIIGILISYLIAGAGVSLNYFLTYDYLSCIILVLSFNSFLVLFVILSEYPNLLFSQSNIEILKSLPISTSVFILAKVISALIYIIFFGVILAIPQAVLYTLIFNNNWVFSISFYIQNILFILFVSSIILIIYSIVIKSFSEKASFVLYVVQAVFIMMILLSTSLTSRTNYKEHYSLLQYSFTKYLPQYFFSLAVDNLLFFILTIILTLIVLFLFYIYIKNNFDVILYKLTAIKQKSKFNRWKIFSAFNKLDYFAEKFILKNSDEKAGFYLTKKLITGSKSMLIKFIPLLIMPVILLIIGIISENNSFLIFKEANSDIEILSPTITIVIFMMFRITNNYLKFTDENSENIQWIYNSLPFSKPKFVFYGSIKYMQLYFFLPVFIIMILLLITKIKPQIVFLNYTFIFSLLILLNKIFITRIKVFPFSIELTKFNTVSRLSEVFVSLILSIIVFLLQLLIFKNITYILISIIFILVTNILFNFIILKYEPRSGKS